MHSPSGTAHLILICFVRVCVPRLVVSADWSLVVNIVFIVNKKNFHNNSRVARSLPGGGIKRQVVPSSCYEALQLCTHDPWSRRSKTPATVSPEQEGAVHQQRVLARRHCKARDQSKKTGELAETWRAFLLNVCFVRNKLVSCDLCDWYATYVHKA